MIIEVLAKIIVGIATILALYFYFYFYTGEHIKQDPAEKKYKDKFMKKGINIEGTVLVTGLIFLVAEIITGKLYFLYIGFALIIVLIVLGAKENNKFRLSKK